MNTSFLINFENCGKVKTIWSKTNLLFFSPKIYFSETISTFLIVLVAAANDLANDDEIDHLFKKIYLRAIIFFFVWQLILMVFYKWKSAPGDLKKLHKTIECFKIYSLFTVFIVGLFFLKKKKSKHWTRFIISFFLYANRNSELVLRCGRFFSSNRRKMWSFNIKRFFFIWSSEIWSL